MINTWRVTHEQIRMERVPDHQGSENEEKNAFLMLYLFYSAGNSFGKHQLTFVEVINDRQRENRRRLLT